MPSCLRKLLSHLDSGPLTSTTRSPHEPRREGRKEKPRPPRGTPDPGPGIRTDSHQWGDDGDQERREEHVGVAVEERQPPRARVPQAQHVGVSVVHLDVSVLGILCREGRAHLQKGARKGAGAHVRHSREQSRAFGSLRNSPPSLDAARPGPSCLTPPS